jgi:hypothetical protein
MQKIPVCVVISLSVNKNLKEDYIGFCYRPKNEEMSLTSFGA